MERKYLLVEDDCAPDARECFNKKLKKQFNLTTNDFILHGVRKEEDDGLTVKRFYKGYCLEFNGDDPYYKLYAI